jgi:hypothetical protein
MKATEYVVRKDETVSGPFQHQAVVWNRYQVAECLKLARRFGHGGVNRGVVVLDGSGGFTVALSIPALSVVYRIVPLRGVEADASLAAAWAESVAKAFEGVQS